MTAFLQKRMWGSTFFLRKSKEVKTCEKDISVSHGNRCRSTRLSASRWWQEGGIQAATIPAALRMPLEAMGGGAPHVSVHHHNLEIFLPLTEGFGLNLPVHAQKK